MNEQIKQIAERLRGLRDALDLSPESVAESCGMPLQHYLDMENGISDITVSSLQRIAHQYNIPLDVLLFGEEPKMNSYFLTRADKGISVERSKAYKYQSLASGFRSRKMDPFEVIVEPKPENTEIHPNSHVGQEFDLVVQGRMMININGKELILNEGDSIYFDSVLPHYMLALDNKPVKFIAIIC